MRLRLFLVLALVVAAPTAAQQVEDARALAEARAAAAAADARAKGYEQAAATAATRADRAHQQAAAISARIDGARADIDAALARVRLVEDARRAQRARLAAKQGATIRLTSAMVGMARRPAALALAQPGSVDDAVHLRALLNATIPAVRARTAALREDAIAAERLRQQADQAVAALRAGQAAFERERTALAAAELAGRNRSVQLTRSAAAEAERAQGLGEEARDLIDLTRRDDAAAGAAARLGQLPGPIQRPGPAAAGSAARPPLYRLPVAGQVIAGLGETADSGVRSRGLAIATAPGAAVTAPLAGTVVYAGRFRSYGGIVILDHGGGWTTLVAGLRTTAVGVGDQVARAQAIGTAGSFRPRVTVELRRGGDPVDLAPLLYPRRS